MFLAALATVAAPAHGQTARRLAPPQPYRVTDEPGSHRVLDPGLQPIDPSVFKQMLEQIQALRLADAMRRPAEPQPGAAKLPHALDEGQLRALRQFQDFLEKQLQREDHGGLNAAAVHALEQWVAEHGLTPPEPASSASESARPPPPGQRAAEQPNEQPGDAAPRDDRSYGSTPERLTPPPPLGVTAEKPSPPRNGAPRRQAEAERRDPERGNSRFNERSPAAAEKGALPAPPERRTGRDGAGPGATVRSPADAAGTPEPSPKSPGQDGEALREALASLLKKIAPPPRDKPGVPPGDSGATRTRTRPESSAETSHAAVPAAPTAPARTVIPPSLSLNETIGRVREAARRASRDPARRRETTGQGSGAWLRGLSSVIDTAGKKVVENAERLQRTPTPRWATAIAARAQKMSRPVVREASRVSEQVRLPEFARSSFSFPRAPQPPSPGTWRRVGEAIACVALLVLAIQLVRTYLVRRDAADAAACEQPIALVQPDDVRTRSDIVRAFESLALIRLGRSAASWAHGRVASAMGVGTPERSRAADQLARLYEIARYAPPNAELGPRQIEEARTCLRRLEGAASPPS